MSRGRKKIATLELSRISYIASLELTNGLDCKMITAGDFREKGPF
jgi:hypothetical protein